MSPKKLRLAIHERQRPNDSPVWDVMRYHPEPHHTAWSLAAVFHDRDLVESYAIATGAEIHPDPDGSHKMETAQRGARRFLGPRRRLCPTAQVVLVPEDTFRDNVDVLAVGYDPDAVDPWAVYFIDIQTAETTGWTYTDTGSRCGSRPSPGLDVTDALSITDCPEAVQDAAWADARRWYESDTDGSEA